MDHLHEKAMLIFLTISQWTARKYDKTVSEEVADKYNAHRDAGRYNKSLIEQDELKELQKNNNAARTFHYENTLPWTDDGNRILPSANYFNYIAEQQKFKSRAGVLAAQFCDRYQELVKRQITRLNGLYNLCDYPDAATIRRKFNFDIIITPLPDSQDFRVNLQNEEIDKIRNQIAAREKDLIAKAMEDCWKRLYNVVSHMAEKLNDQKATFRDSLVGNIVELVQLLPKLNLTDNQELETMRKQIEARLIRVKPDTLRSSKTIRRQVAKEASAILDTMAGYVE